MWITVASINIQDQPESITEGGQNHFCVDQIWEPSSGIQLSLGAPLLLWCVHTHKIWNILTI